MGYQLELIVEGRFQTLYYCDHCTPDMKREKSDSIIIIIIKCLAFLLFLMLTLLVVPMLQIIVIILEVVQYILGVDMEKEMNLVSCALFPQLWGYAFRRIREK